MTKCHIAPVADHHPSRHGIVDDSYLTKGRADMWHSKAARGAAAISAMRKDIKVDAISHEVISGTYRMLGWVDDKYVDVWADDSINGEDGGRYPDKGKSAYSHNRIKDKSRPKYMEKNPRDYSDAMFLLQSEINSGECVGDGAKGISDTEATAYWSRYAELHAVVPERILRVPKGSRADIKFGAVWKDGQWTAEITRKLNTYIDDDIQFNGSTEYPFGIAIFDNSRHGYEHKTSEMYGLKFIR